MFLDLTGATMGAVFQGRLQRIPRFDKRVGIRRRQERNVVEPGTTDSAAGFGPQPLKPRRDVAGEERRFFNDLSNAREKRGRNVGLAVLLERRDERLADLLRSKGPLVAAVGNMPPSAPHRKAPVWSVTHGRLQCQT